MSSIAVIIFKGILIPEFITIVIAFALHIVFEFCFIKIDYILLINASNMFLNLIDQICGVK